MNLSRILLLLGLIGVIYAAIPSRPPKTGPDFHAFGQIPVVSGGRIKPLDTVARNALLEISGRSVVREKASGEDGKSLKMDHNAWLAEVLFDSPAAGQRKVLLVENEEVKALFGKQGAASDKRFSMAEIAPSSQKIQELAQAAAEKPADRRNVFERQVTALYERITVIGKLFHSVTPPGLRDYKLRMDNFPALVGVVVPETEKLQRGEPYNENVVREMSMMLQAFQSLQRLHAFYPIPPREQADKLENWSDAGTVVLNEVARGAPHAALDNWARISDAYHRIPEDNGVAFNAEVQRHRDWLAGQGFGGLTKSKAESWFNHFGPFYACMVLYVSAFLLVLAAWLTRSDALREAAWKFLVLTLVVHTIGLGLRIWLSGRPPVTNLYSSAVFIGWGALVFCLLLERWFLKNGIGSATAALIGFATLLVAHHLSFDGDTMEVKQAVLDSNFWLATHVVVVTLGYSATFLAGFLAIVWLFLRLGKAEFFDMRSRKILTGSVYGIVCFALLFSFTGTVLGGIWGDQSWGRFWGWDPKENGALLIVLWNAIILHSRWGGMIRERGIMVLAMAGNIITAWSWFGTNMLGIGLHSYGFMEAAFYALISFIGVQLLLMALVWFIPAKEEKAKSDGPEKLPAPGPA